MPESPRESLPVERVMTRATVSCGPFDPLRAAAETMLRADVSCLPVLAADGSLRVVGMLTDGDISRAAARDEVAQLKVRSAMSVAVVSCAPTDALGRALSEMREAGVRWLPVVDILGRLVGLLSLSDVAADGPRPVG